MGGDGAVQVANSVFEGLITGIVLFLFLWEGKS
jgi:hypothetical protein